MSMFDITYKHNTAETTTVTGWFRLNELDKRIINNFNAGIKDKLYFNGKEYTIGKIIYFESDGEEYIAQLNLIECKP